MESAAASCYPSVFVAICALAVNSRYCDDLCGDVTLSVCLSVTLGSHLNISKTDCPILVNKFHQNKLVDVGFKKV